MKKINLFLTILAAAAGFTNCSKAELVENKETEKGGSVVYATTDAATKTTLANDYKVLWSEGDKITFVKDGATNTTYTYTLSSGAGTTSGTFTCAQTPENGTYTVWYNYDKNEGYWYLQNYVSAADISKAPMKATVTVSDGIVSDISFKNEGGILRYTVKGNKTIGSIKVQSASRELDVTLSCGDGVALTEGGTVFNIVVKPGTYSDVTLTFSATDFTLATKKASSFVVKKNTVSLATFEAADLLFLPAGALKGVFTVGKGADGEEGTADDVKVRFSQGNLKYNQTGDEPKWKFYDHQYDYLKGFEYSPVSLFPWGYDANSEHISLDSSDYVEDHTNEGDKLVYDKASSEGGDDWGVAYCESNNITVGIWRMLSKEEWVYLINTRTMTNGKARYSIAMRDFTIGGTNYYGVFLYPDNYNGEVVSGSMTWDAINAAGIVFLPAAGYYNSGQVSADENEGFYWSSSACSYGSSYLMYFSSVDVTPDRGDLQSTEWSARHQKYSVRLVTEVK
ncbi:MAG: hypothetical protein MJZ17_04540 [Bacteroidales bacterium]|nr:hypothetical protein [Bacteroidales bacterium]